MNEDLDGAETERLEYNVKPDKKSYRLFSPLRNTELQR